MSSVKGLLFFCLGALALAFSAGTNIGLAAEDESFDVWLAAFRADAKAAGISPAIIEATLDNLQHL
ncbi:MAG: hypothetical protein ACR2QF_18405, partial [Geminicoccaceae bacterium]